MISNINQTLIEYNTDTVSHTGRTLFEHFIGTGDLLKEWGCSNYLYLAGYFHAFYGTEGSLNGFHIFKFEEREKLQNIIGEKAEHLVFLYCISKRRRTYYEQIARKGYFYVTNRLTDEKISINKEVLIDLICLDIANLIEELDRQPLFNQRLLRWIGRLWFRFKYIKRHYQSLGYLPNQAQELVKDKFHIDVNKYSL